MSAGRRRRLGLRARVTLAFAFGALLLVLGFKLRGRRETGGAAAAV